MFGAHPLCSFSLLFFPLAQVSQICPKQPYIKKAGGEGVKCVSLFTSSLSQFVFSSSKVSVTSRLPKVFFRLRLYLEPHFPVTSGCKNQDGDGPHANLESSKRQSVNQWHHSYFVHFLQSVKTLDPTLQVMQVHVILLLDSPWKETQLLPYAWSDFPG